MRYPSSHSSAAGGAGYLSPLAGSMLEILDKVLVDGYSIGETLVPSLGWSRPFDRFLNVCVYRQGAGNQLMFRVDDYKTAATYKVCGISCFDSMSDVNTGLGEWGAAYLGKTSGSNPAAPLNYSPAWWIVGDAKGFYLLVGDHESYPLHVTRGVPVVVHYLGDFDSLEASDAYATLLLSHSNSGLLPSAAASSFFKQWGAVNFAAATGKVYAASVGGAKGVATGLISPEGARVIGTTAAPVNPNTLVQGASVPRLSSVLLSGVTAPRGKMPGLFSVWPHIAGATGDTFTSKDGNQFMLVNTQLTATSWEQYAIQLDTW